MLLFQLFSDSATGFAWVSSVDGGHRVCATLTSDLAWSTPSERVALAKRLLLEQALPPGFRVDLYRSGISCSRCGAVWSSPDPEQDVVVGGACPVGNPVGDGDDPNVTCGELGGRLGYGDPVLHQALNPTLPRLLRRAYIDAELEPPTCRLPGEDDWIRATALAAAICARAGDDRRALEILDASGVNVETLALDELQGGIADYDANDLLPLLVGPMCEEGAESLKPKPTWSLPEPPAPGMQPWAEVAMKDGVRGWRLFWARESNLMDADPKVGDFIRWPFGVDDAAALSDLQALGFKDVDSTLEESMPKGGFDVEWGEGVFPMGEAGGDL